MLLQAWPTPWSMGKALDFLTKSQMGRGFQALPTEPWLLTMTLPADLIAEETLEHPSPQEKYWM